MSKLQFTDTEKRILALVQGDLPDSATPYADIAAEAGATEDEVLALLRRLKDTRVIRRFGATLRHQKAGYGSNAMVAWRVSAEDADRIGEYMAGRPEISHCYIRRTYPEWTMNLYTMVHAKSREECARTVREISEASGASDYEMLLSVRELKKTSMRYF